MTVKTITVTEAAYGALSAMKAPRESFSDTILRVSGRRSLREFIGTLTRPSADKLELAIREVRKKHSGVHNRRISDIMNKFQKY